MRLEGVWPLAMAALVLSGCAGGWRNGPPPGTDTGSASASAATAAGGATASDVGVHFIYRGEASSVSLAGEFNGWNATADAMTKQADGSWQIVKKLEPGRYPYKFVIDGRRTTRRRNRSTTASGARTPSSSWAAVGPLRQPQPRPRRRPHRRRRRRPRPAAGPRACPTAFTSCIEAPVAA